MGGVWYSDSSTGFIAAAFTLLLSLSSQTAFSNTHTHTHTPKILDVLGWKKNDVTVAPLLLVSLPGEGLVAHMKLIAAARLCFSCEVQISVV